MHGVGEYCMSIGLQDTMLYEFKMKPIPEIVTHTPKMFILGPFPPSGTVQY